MYYDALPPPSLKQRLASSLQPDPNWWRSAFPILQWLPHYNRQWFYSDLLCGLTVGIVVIPQSMAYAKMAELPPSLGLYSSITGVFIYPFIGTSKDISIGTTAINSLLVGNIIVDIVNTPQFQSGLWTYAHVAGFITLCTGIINLLVASLRLGLLFDFISQPLLAGFMAGSGLTIVVNQLCKVLGIPSIDTTKPTYLIFGETLINLPHIHLDAVLGISALIFLYSVRYWTARWTKQYPHRARLFFFLNISRNIVVIIFSTLLAFLVQHIHGSSPFITLGHIPAGFQNMGVPQWDSALLSMVMSKLIGVVVLQIMEHCAIATSLGKIADYKIRVNQEIMSIGLANIFGSFFSAYPMTGAFSRTAVTAKSGARSPLCNIFAGTIVILTIYFFTPALQFIPNAAIGAIVCHAVTDLICGPRVWVKFWNTHPSEFLIFASAYIISLVTRMDIAVYIPLALSIVIQLYRLARPSFTLLGRVDLPKEPTSPTSDAITNVKEKHMLDKSPMTTANQRSLVHLQHVQLLQNNTHFVSLTDPVFHGRVIPIAPSILCFRPCADLVFENVNYLFSQLMDMVKEQTCRGKPLPLGIGGRPWNDPVASNDKGREKPVLSSVVLDLSAVYILDYSAMEALAELSRMVDQYTGNATPWFFVLNDSVHVRHGLLYAGFGRQHRKQVQTNVFRFHNDLKKKKPATPTHRLLPRFFAKPPSPASPAPSSLDLEKNDIVTTAIEDVNHHPRRRCDTRSRTSASSVSYQDVNWPPPWTQCPEDDDDDNDDSDDDDQPDDQKDVPADHPFTRPEAATIQDRYPYFFHSLLDAANAALVFLDLELQHDQHSSSPLETISIEAP
ncbi:sulfate permease [Hesseltinella vesiculosa]|uniref:Sulfate permease n=1 Tax=Hesseltinella vesiculosa TaxID=101127 RepID=A0A1X2GYC1_9FUNG|nr:sulfate permease [Hesseltinella vesiculosa]